MNFLVNEDLGLTTAGYVVSIAAAVIALLAGALLLGRKREGKTLGSTKKLVFCAMGLALAFVLSYIKLWAMPYGGSVTAFSMLFIVLIGYWYGPQTGMLIGFVYGVMQFLQEPYILSFFQVCCDYLLAFAMLGLGGFFKDQKNGLIKGYLVSVVGRGFFHALGGYLYWMEYMPENFPKSLAFAYPIVYNYGFLLAEAVITVIILLIPAVRKAIDQVGRQANS